MGTLRRGNRGRGNQGEVPRPARRLGVLATTALLNRTAPGENAPVENIKLLYLLCCRE